MSLTYLNHEVPEKNMHRFYYTTVMLGLLGEWALVREWGRIGSLGTVRKTWLRYTNQTYKLIASYHYHALVFQ